MNRAMTACLAGAALVLAGCGTGPGERAVSGAGIGALAGALVGAVSGLSILQGALIGAAAGGLAGGLTSAEIINLGDPYWATNQKQANAAATARVQAGLTRLGYRPGAVDGVMGANTDLAIRAYQRDHQLTVNGRPTYILARHIDELLESAAN